MNLAAIRHSGTARDCFCLEPGRFLFRLQSARGDLTRAVLHVQDKYLPLSIMDTRAAVPMTKASSDGTLDYWEAELTFDVVCLRYWFALTDTAGKTVFYSGHRFPDCPPEDIEEMFDCPQNLREEERVCVPQWAENKVVYQVFPSRFASSRPVDPELWYKAPISSRDDLHGDLRGLTERLPHLRELGADVLYMTPLFRSDSCHKYDTIDYYTVDPAFGTKEDLVELVRQAHDMGIRVILDGVFNHTSPDFFAFADIRKNGPDSRYLDWYFIREFPLRAAWGEKPSYKTFSYFGGMPKLNVRNPEVARYILDVALYWLRETGADGWRLDVGDEIGHSFWRKFRQAVKEEFPEALIVGEVWHYAPDFLQGDEWDTVMNYPFYRRVLALAARGEAKVSELADQLHFFRGRLHPRMYPILWNLAGSHDTPRLLHCCGGNKDRMKLAAALLLLLPGMPMIYYGDEYAMDGGRDPDCRRGMVWDPARQDGDMFRWYQGLIRLRRECPGILDPQASDTADDGRGLLLRRAGGYTMVFYCKDTPLPLPEWAGCRELITGSVFSGTAAPFGVLVFEDGSDGGNR